MKRILTISLILILIFTLVSCGNKEVSSEQKEVVEHVHEYGEIYQENGIHYQKCTGCEDVKEVGECTFESVTSETKITYTCSVCGNTYEEEVEIVEIEYKEMYLKDMTHNSWGKGAGTTEGRDYGKLKFYLEWEKTDSIIKGEVVKLSDEKAGKLTYLGDNTWNWDLSDATPGEYKFQYVDGNTIYQAGASVSKNQLSGLMFVEFIDKKSEYGDGGDSGVGMAQGTDLGRVKFYTLDSKSDKVYINAKDITFPAGSAEITYYDNGECNFKLGSVKGNYKATATVNGKKVKFSIEVD